MSVLLAINCAADASYANRHVLAELYRDRFDALAFVVNATCALDSRYRNIVARWSPPADAPDCICGSPGRHPAARHVLHPRWWELAQLGDDFEMAVFADDDCYLSLCLNSATVRQRCDGFDALTPPVFYCQPDTDWVWAQHATGRPAYQAATGHWDREQLLRRWDRYGGRLVNGSAQPMFYGFSDCAVLRFGFLRRIADDLERLFPVWHEIALPSVCLYHAERLGRLSVAALWYAQRQQPLADTLGLLSRFDFVHPVKTSRYDPTELLASYRQVSAR